MEFDEEDLAPEVIEGILRMVEGELKLDGMYRDKKTLIFFNLCRGTKLSRSLKEIVLR